MNRENERAQWREHVAERNAVVTQEVEREKGIYAQLQRAQISCHSGGTCHEASICMDCPRYVGAAVSPDGSVVTVRCWWYEGDRSY